MTETPHTITSAGTRLRVLTDEKEVLNSQLSEINKEIGFLKDTKLPELMEEAEIEKVTIENVGSISIKGKMRAYIRADDKEKAFEWITEIGEGSIIKETIHPSTLSSFVKERYDAGLDVPDYFNPKPFMQAALRRK